MRKYIFLFAALGWVLSSCHGAKYHYRQGNKYSEVNLLKRAVTEYKMALNRKPTKLKYVLAMNTSGNALLSELYGNVQLTSSDSTFIYGYLDAEKWRKFLTPYVENVELYKSAILEEEFQKIKESYIHDEVERSKGWIRNNQFVIAQNKLAELQSLDPRNNEVAELLQFAEVEPVYRDALDWFDRQEYRKVYELVEPLIRKYPNQKDLTALQNEALSRGVFRLGFTDAEGTGTEVNFLNSIRSGVITQVSKYRDPFLEMLDRTNFELLRSEQEAILDGVTSEGRGLRQELLAADAFVTLDIVIMDEVEGDVRHEEKKGWEETFVKSKNSEGEVITKSVFNKVKYDEYYQKNEVRYEVNLSLVNRASSLIMESHAVSFVDQDEVRYIVFNGKGKLYPGYWKWLLIDSKSDYRSMNFREINEVAKMRKSDRRIKSTGQMRRTASTQMSSQLAEFIYNLKLQSR